MSEEENTQNTEEEKSATQEVETPDAETSETEGTEVNEETSDAPEQDEPEQDETEDETVELKAQEPTQEEITLFNNLKLEAESLGVLITENETIDSLNEKITEHKKKSLTGAPKPLAETKVMDAKQAELKKKQRAAKKLVRVQIHCNDPKIANRGCILRDVANKYVQIKKVIPFNTPTHVPQFLLNTMKNEKYVAFGRKKLKGGVEVADPKLVPTFSIEYLEPLTVEEFERIAIRQQAERRVNG